MYPPQYSSSIPPPIHFMEVENFPYEPISSPNIKKLSILLNHAPPPNIQKWSILLHHPPNVQHRFAPLSIRRDFDYFFSNLILQNKNLRLFYKAYPESSAVSGLPADQPEKSPKLTSK